MAALLNARPPAQRAAVEEEEVAQGRFATVQRAGAQEEDLLQGRFATVQRAADEEELLQGRFATVQRTGAQEEELQMKAASANTTGLPDGLKSGVEAMSGMSLDGVQVHYNSSKPAQLNAHAYAQGTDIHIAPGQEQHLPHEAWHVVQQAQGRVKPTMQMKAGVPVNDDPGLEREADVMGARAMGAAVQRHPDVSRANFFGPSVVVQRAVTDFQYQSSRFDPPGTDIMETIDDDDFVQTRKTISNRVRTYLLDPLVKTLEVPESVIATLVQSDMGASHPNRQGSRSRNIGQIGRDEFWIKTGLLENFEGGHIIPHSLWDDDDSDVEHAGSYVNLVPMSRTLNVMAWAGKEEEIKKKLEEIDDGDELEVTVDITHQNYQVTNQQIADRFGLTVAGGADANRKYTLYGWNLANASVSWVHLDTGSDLDLSDVEENNLRNTYDEIDDPADFIEALQNSGFWMRMSDNLKGKIENL